MSLLSLEAGIEALCDAVAKQDIDAFKKASSKVDWVAWNDVMVQKKDQDYQSSLTFLHALDPGGKDYETEAKFFKKAINILLKDGCNICLDWWEGDILIEMPQFAPLYCKAHVKYGWADQNGRNPLHVLMTMMPPYKGSALKCLKAGVNPNAVDHEGKNALYTFWETLAFAGNDLDAMDIGRVGGNLWALLRGGANPDMATVHGQTSWDMMATAFAQSRVLQDNALALDAMMREQTAINNAKRLEQNTPVVCAKKNASFRL